MSKLISISDLIHQAKLRGVNLGSGNPRTHLTYLSEIGLLPSAIRRKSNSSLEGHYPNDALETLGKIESLKSQGLSYNQIKNQLYVPAPSSPPNNSLAFLIIGLILGFLLARGQTAAAPSSVLAAQVSLDKTDQSIYLLSIPKEYINLNKIEWKPNNK
ncbi:MAG: hypothetical protein AAB506_01620 [Patescibacteria group bacterium]